jgi:hypothetical protein
MTAITKTNINNALKRLYVGQKMASVIYGSSQRPFLNMVKKNTGFGGRDYPIPVYFEDAVGGRSYTFTNAQSNCNAPQIAEFAIDVKQNYEVVQITTDAMLRARKDVASFIRNQVLRVDMALNALANNIEFGLFHTSEGFIGQTNNASFGVKTLDLVIDEDAKNFSVGMYLKWAANSAAAPRANRLLVAGVNRTGTTMQVTLNGYLNAITSIAQNDYVFVESDYVSASDTNKISGVGSWCPATAPSGGDSFFGQDRSSEPNRLAGHPLTGSLNDIKKAITDAAAQMASHGGACDTCFMDYTDWAALEDQLEGDVLRQPGAKAVAGYQYLQIYGATGPIRIVPALFCPKSTIYLMKMSSCELVSMGPVVRINNDDGLMANKVYNADALEIRADSHAQLAFHRPLDLCRITLS